MTRDRERQAGNQSTNDEKTVAGLAMARCGEAMDGKEVQRKYAAAAPCIACPACLYFFFSFSFFACVTRTDALSTEHSSPVRVIASS